jgi:hypothetical protein
MAHLFTATCHAYVNVVTARTLTRLSEEVVIGRIRIGCEQVSEAFKRTNECLPLFNVTHRDLNIDDRLRGQIWHGSRADVFDPKEDITQGVSNRSRLTLEFAHPLRVVGNDVYRWIESLFETWMAL